MLERLRRTRVRLTLIYGAAFTLVAGAAAIAFWFAFSSIEYNSIDSSLRAQAQVVLGGLEVTDGQVSFGGGPLPDQTQGGVAVLAVLLTPQGAVLDQSSQVTDPRQYAAAAQRSGATESDLRDMRVNGHLYRVLVQQAQLGGGVQSVLVVARPIDELHETLTEVALLLAAAGIVLVLGAGVLAYWLAGRALHPVRVMSATAREISEQDLHRRIALDLPPGDELGDLGSTFNAMLSRLESAFEGLRRFTADAAHELRAPLALMRTQVDVTLRKERSAGEYQESHRQLLAEIERLTRLSDQLLMLARADAGALVPRLEEVDLPQLLEEVAERWRPLAFERGVSLQVDLPISGVLRADPDLLHRLLDNLIDNAVRHTPAGGVVRLVAAPLPGGGAAAGQVGEPAAVGAWELAVEDSGPGVSPELRERIFERFARGDEARGRATGGAGLGLALCSVIVFAHAGTIRLDGQGEEPGARFVVRLPAGGPGAAAPASAAPERQRARRGPG